jgi:hypothetical protein
MGISARDPLGQIVSLLRISPLLMVLSGCAALYQDHTTALVREPGHYLYGDPLPVDQVARKYWEYATIAGLAYPGDELPDQTACATSQDSGSSNAETSNLAAADVQALGNQKFSKIFDTLQDLGWAKWRDFPDGELYNRMKKLDLYVTVWERKSSKRTTVVVAFKGTDFWSWQDWNSNLRWFTRLIPGDIDQYDEVVDYFGPAFVKAYKTHVTTSDEKGADVVYATGHSLGGGLAQQFAYALPLNDPQGPPDERVPRVSRVYAFDPSPVTGYYSVPEHIRDVNKLGLANEAKGLEIGRVLEKGEILSYLRGLVSLVYFPSGMDPAIEGVRFNLFPSLNPIESHSIDELACKLFDAATSTGQPPAHYDPEDQTVTTQ